MLSCLTFSKQLKEISRFVVCMGLVCISYLVISEFGLQKRVQAGDSTLRPPQPSSAAAKIQPKLVASYGKLPLSFEANQGQVSGPAKFLSHGRGYTLFLSDDEAVLNLGKSSGGKGATENGTAATGSILRMKLVGASASAAVAGADELPGKSNYFIGNDPKQWRTNLPNYAKVKYQNVYPGVDLVYYGTQGGQLEYDFVVAPGGDAQIIGLSFQGAGKIRVDKHTGDLILTLHDSQLRFRKPVVYQPASGSELSTDRHAISGRFVLKGRNQIGFQVAAYDRRAPLIIDPALDYSTYLGGGYANFGTRVAVDASGSVYVAGITDSNDFPTTAGAFSSLLATGVPCSTFNWHRSFPCPDAFVTKLDPTLSQVVYSTYLGGSQADGATGISVDSSGNAYVTGTTGSVDFPTTPGAFLTTASVRRAHAFATKLNAAGSALIYSTYLGGSADDGSTNSALDSSGNLYVAGTTTSTDFPTTRGAFQTAIAAGSCGSHPCADGFITKLNSQGSAPIYSTLLGGNNHSVVLGLAVDSAGSVYLTGGTLATNFPTANAFQSSFGTATCGTSSSGKAEPCFHAFVSKLNPLGTALAYSTYLGGHGFDAGMGIAVDATGSAYVTGATNSVQFPTTAGAAQTNFGGGTCGNLANSFNCPDAFVTKLAPTGALAYSTFLGGSSFDLGMGITVDGAGNAYVVGGTNSLDFPTDATTGNFQGGTCSTTLSGSGYNFNCPNAFLTKIDSTGATRLFSTYLGGASGDVAMGVALDASGDTYVAGFTLSSNFPVSAGAFQTSMTGYADGFVSRFGAPLAATPSFSIPTGNYTSAQTVTISDATAGATIYYTTNGTIPTTASTPYTGAITVNSSETIQAIAAASGYSNSPAAMATYNITINTWSAAATPWFSVLSGTYMSVQTVTIEDATAGAAIYYTTDGTTPTTASTRYTGAITVNSTETIEAIAVASGYNNSAVATATYVIHLTALHEWTWIGGSSTVGSNGGQPGVYGTLGTPAAGNVPGSRVAGNSWTDSSGNFWLFGGYGFDSNGSVDHLNDLWEFNPSTYEWTWFGGSSTVGNQGGQPGVYGTLGTPAAGNVPGGRGSSTYWTDSSGNFWLFGGDGADSIGTQGYLNDLWEFNPSTKQWAWMGGSNTAPNTGLIGGQPGVYGTLGTPATGNVPGGRFGGNSATDGSGNLWLFGGAGADSTGTTGYLNDLWEFNPSTKQWAWMSGSSTVGFEWSGKSGVYGTMGSPAAGNVPGGRYGGNSWTDRSGNFWLFGGDGFDSTGNEGNLNDLWEFNPSTKQWAWMGGSSTVGISWGGQPGVYGTLGTPAAGNVPGGREDATSWTDQSGNFWLFGGGPGSDSNGNTGYLNDLWEFNPSTKEWTWMGGSSTINNDWYGQPGVYGTLGTPYPETVPGSRQSAGAWTDSSGNLWLFGGAGLDSSGFYGYLNDLWEYQPYAITLPADTPVFSVPPGSYSSAQTVIISDATPGATIYYTTNGTTPTTASAPYTGAITVSSTETIEAIATASGYSTSAVVTATYTITITALPIAGVSPGTLTFSSQAVGTTSASQPVTLSNTGSAALTIASITASGDFSQTNTCGSSVAANSNCTINVTFKPIATGARTGTLTITDNSNGTAGSTQTVTLTGTGGTSTPVAGVSPGSLTFSSQAVGTTSTSQQVTLSNTGTATLTITSIAVSANFGEANNCGTSVAAGGSCTINVTFSPTAVGSTNGTLTITDNSDGVAGSTQTVNLSGSGTIPDFALVASSGSSTSATVAPGSAATYVLSVAGEGGFTGAVTFTCTGAPSGATCTVWPSTVTTLSSATNVTVTAATTASSVSTPRARPIPPVPPLSPGLRGLLMLALVLGAMAWAIGRRNQPGVTRWRSTMVPLTAGFLLALALAGCGGGGGGGGGSPAPLSPAPVTPAGTYNLTVTGTTGSGSSALSHSVTLTLKVS